MVKDSLSSSNKSLTLIVILSLIVMAISIGFTVMTTRFVVKSLSKLQQGILGFFSFLNEESKSATLIDLKSNDEFGEIAKVINQNIEKTESSIKKDDEFIHATELFIKETLSRIYYDIGYKKQAKAIDVENWFVIKSCLMNEGNKRVNAFKLIQRKQC
jgi:methyl-accepting chemotaxis protein